MPTRIHRLAPQIERRIYLAILGAVALAGVAVGTAPIVSAVVPEQNDIAMYQAIVERVRGGERYHTAVGTELRTRGYASREIFNWRTPLHLTAVAAASDAVARITLITLVTGLAVAGVLSVRRFGSVATASAAVWLLGSMALTSAPAAVFMSEAWAGVMIGFSVIAFAQGRTAAAVFSGMLALFIRELAAPYCVACTLAAAWRKRWSEAAWWMVGAVAYAWYYAWHVSEVLPLRLSTDVGHGSSWLELGGLPFVLATFEWSGWLFVLPNVFHVGALVLVVAGVLHRQTPFHVRLTCSAFLLWYSVAGKPFDHYWGLMAAPTMALAGGIGANATWAAIRAELSEPPS